MQIVLKSLKENFIIFCLKMINQSFYNFSAFILLHSSILQMFLRYSELQISFVENPF